MFKLEPRLCAVTIVFKNGSPCSSSCDGMLLTSLDAVDMPQMRQEA